MSDQSASDIWMTCFSWSNSRQRENDGWRQWEIYRQTETLRGKCLQQHLTQFLQNLQHIKSHFCLHCINFEMRCFVLIIFAIFWTVFIVSYLLFPLPFLRLLRSILCYSDRFLMLSTQKKCIFGRMYSNYWRMLYNDYVFLLVEHNPWFSSFFMFFCSCSSFFLFLSMLIFVFLFCSLLFVFIMFVLIRDAIPIQPLRFLVSQQFCKCIHLYYIKYIYIYIYSSLLIYLFIIIFIYIYIYIYIYLFILIFIYIYIYLFIYLDALIYM